MPVEYEPPVEEIKADYERLCKSKHKPSKKIIAKDGTMVGYILNNTAYIGSWQYPVDGFTFKEWMKLNHITLKK